MYMIGLSSYDTNNISRARDDYDLIVLTLWAILTISFRDSLLEFLDGV